MIDYLIALLAFISFYKGVRFTFDWKKLDYKPMPLKYGKPFFWKKGKTGVLLIHGFSATAHEMIGLGKFLHGKGFTVYAPLLPGHGTSPEDLATKKWKDWQYTVDQSLTKLKKSVDKVYVLGSSFGGNLAIILAANRRVDGLISLGTPLYFRKDRIIRVLLPFLKKVKTFHSKRYKKEDLKRIGENGEYKTAHYHIIPLQAASEVLIAISKSRWVLSKIKCPALVVQSSSDFQLKNSNAIRLCKKLGSKYKKLIFMPNAYHVLMHDKNKLEVFDKILTFLKEKKEF